jgi:hypothetical protein
MLIREVILTHSRGPDGQNFMLEFRNHNLEGNKRELELSIINQLCK